MICFNTRASTQPLIHMRARIHDAQGWQALAFKRLLQKAPLQCRRFQPQLYGEYMVVKLLMKMEESVYSSKQLSVKDGEVIYSLYEEQHFFPL